MEQRPPNIVLPIIAAFVGLVGVVSVVIYYGRQQIDLPPAGEAPAAVVQASSSREIFEQEVNSLDTKDTKTSATSSPVADAFE